MPKLENLKISYHHNRNPVQRIEGDPFAALKVVTLSSCLEPTIVFRPAVLASVQTFILYTVSSAQPIAGYTRWDEVFPNLEVFVYNNLNSNGVIDFPHFEFLVTHMQNPSLKTVEYTLHPVRGASYFRLSTYKLLKSGFCKYISYYFDSKSKKGSRVSNQTDSVRI